MGNAVKINRLLIVCFGIVQGGEEVGVGVDGSLGAEQPWEQRLLSSSVLCSPGSGAGGLQGSHSNTGDRAWEGS